MYTRGQLMDMTKSKLAMIFNKQTGVPIATLLKKPKWGLVEVILAVQVADQNIAAKRAIDKSE